MKSNGEKKFMFSPSNYITNCYESSCRLKVTMNDNEWDQNHLCSYDNNNSNFFSLSFLTTWLTWLLWVYLDCQRGFNCNLVELFEVRAKKESPTI